MTRILIHFLQKNDKVVESVIFIDKNYDDVNKVHLMQMILGQQKNKNIKRAFNVIQSILVNVLKTGYCNLLNRLEKHFLIIYQPFYIAEQQGIDYIIIFDINISITVFDGNKALLKALRELKKSKKSIKMINNLIIIV